VSGGGGAGGDDAAAGARARREAFAAEHLSWRLVSDARTLASLLETLEAWRAEGRLSAIAVDFEFTMNPDPEKRRLRLVQIGVGGSGSELPEEQHLVDAQAVEARSLQRLFGDPALTKVMHTPSGDYEQWLRYLGRDADWEGAFRAVYDPSARLFLLRDELLRRRLAYEHPLLACAEATAGRHVGLTTLVEAVLGFTLAKRHQQARWGAPVLGHGALRYAALDVAVLPYVRAAVLALEEELRALGLEADARAREVHEDELAYAIELASIPVPRRKQLRGGLGRARYVARKRGGSHLVARDVNDVELRYLRRLHDRARGAERLELADGVVTLVGGG